jgi:hypothetical protein
LARNASRPTRWWLASWPMCAPGATTPCAIIQPAHRRRPNWRTLRVPGSRSTGPGRRTPPRCARRSRAGRPAHRGLSPAGSTAIPGWIGTTRAARWGRWSARWSESASMPPTARALSLIVAHGRHPRPVAGVTEIVVATPPRDGELNDTIWPPPMWPASTRCTPSAARRPSAPWPMAPSRSAPSTRFWGPAISLSCWPSGGVWRGGYRPAARPHRDAAHRRRHRQLRAMVAADMLAQAEHDPMATALLLTTSPALAAVRTEVAAQHGAAEPAGLSPPPRCNSRSGIVVVDSTWTRPWNWPTSTRPSISACSRAPWELVGRVRNAGGVFRGRVVVRGAGRLCRRPQPHHAHRPDGALFLAPEGVGFRQDHQRIRRQRRASRVRRSAPPPSPGRGRRASPPMPGPCACAWAIGEGKSHHESTDRPISGQDRRVDRRAGQGLKEYAPEPLEANSPRGCASRGTTHQAGRQREPLRSQPTRP